jgi:hypothetical protein
MSKGRRKFELPGALDRHLGTLSKLYAQDGKRDLQEILVNARIRVQEERSFDNWNGGTFGHALYMLLPESLFLANVKKKEALQAQFKEDLNKIHSIQNEFIEEVFIEMDAAEDQDWRKSSGLLSVNRRDVSPTATKRIWGDTGFRVFLSHKTEVKRETADLKEGLCLFGVSCFVAHEDIHPTEKWQDEIENALATMDAFVALLTDDFHKSLWTDQEVGYAFARGVPIIAFRLGLDPYGFIAKFQALSCTWHKAPHEIAKLLIKQDRMFSAYVGALRRCPSWDDGNILARALEGIEALTEEQIDELVAAYNETSELRGSFAFHGGKPARYGPGLVSYLNRFGAREFRFSESGLIERVPQSRSTRKASSKKT